VSSADALAGQMCEALPLQTVKLPFSISNVTQHVSLSLTVHGDLAHFLL
jgi:hypothetical protein